MCQLNRKVTPFVKSVYFCFLQFMNYKFLALCALWLSQIPFLLYEHRMFLLSVQNISDSIFTAVPSIPRCHKWSFPSSFPIQICNTVYCCSLEYLLGLLLGMKDVLTPHPHLVPKQIMGTAILLLLPPCLPPMRCFGVTLTLNFSLQELHILNTLSVGTAVYIPISYVSVLNRLVLVTVNTDFVCNYIYSTLGCDGSSLPQQFLLFAALGRRCWDNGWLILLVVYQIAFLCVLPVKIMETSVPPALSLALLLEQVRKRCLCCSLCIILRSTM